MQLQHSNIIEYERYRLECLKLIRDVAPRDYLRSSADPWIAVGFRSCATAQEVADGFLRDELKTFSKTGVRPPQAPFDVHSGVWLHPALSTMFAEMAARVRVAFLGYQPCITDTAGVYVRPNVRGEKASKVGSSSNLENRFAATGKRAQCFAWLPFGGLVLERRCQAALAATRCDDHPEGRELFRVTTEQAVSALLDTALEYLQREKTALEGYTQAHDSWTHIKKTSRYLRDNPPYVVTGLAPGQLAAVTNERGAPSSTTSLHRHSVPFPLAGLPR